MKNAKSENPIGTASMLNVLEEKESDDRLAALLGTPVGVAETHGSAKMCL